ncbi:MAG: hypothetical protein MUF25_01940 [Pirellulaceae bacterium]|nr:hypothetical protein [Pirellulaceae bacterium]
MNHDELVFEALCYRRHTGATLADIRGYLQFREEGKHTQQDDRQVLSQLETAGTLVRVGKKWFFTRDGYKRAKGRALEPEWQPEDPWILLAALYNRDEDAIPLRKIVAAADAINHAIPTLEETHGALNRLAAGRLLKAKRETFSVTPKAVELFEKVQSSCGRAMLDHLDGLRSILDCPCCGVRLKKVHWNIVLGSATINAAVEAYGATFR